MYTSFESQFAPLTFTRGFIGAPLDAVKAALSSWRETHAKKVDVRKLCGSLPDLLHQLEPLTTPENREIIVGTDSPWTAYFSNGLRGSEAENPVGVLCESYLKCRGVVATAIPDTISREHPRGVYGCVSFTLFGPEEGEWLNIIRQVLAMNDGGRWIFETIGDPLPFEHPECYAARRIIDRLTPALIEQYCKALGIRVFDEDFYQPDGYLLRLHQIMPWNYPRASLREARKRLGFTEAISLLPGMKTDERERT